MAELKDAQADLDLRSPVAKYSLRGQSDMAELKDAQADLDLRSPNAPENLFP